MPVTPEMARSVNRRMEHSQADQGI
jgi:hypothetical protein